MVCPEFANNQRQIVVTQKGRHVIFDFCAGLVHLIHVDREHGIGEGIRSRNLRGMRQHHFFPVLSPVGRIHQQRVR